MSETTTVPAVITPATPPVVVANPPPVTSSGIGSAIGSMGVGGSLGIVITYFFGLAHVQIPGEVSVAMVTLLSAAAHFIQDRYIGHPKA